MREAMMLAEVGDDVYGEDPDVNKLQDYAADIMGKEAALFVTSGTQGNLSALLAHCARGTEVIVGSESHILNYEGGGASAYGGIIYRTVVNRPNGEMPVADLDRSWRGEDQHFSPTALVCLETSHNRCGGPVLSLEYMDTVKQWADAKGVPIHLDGARIFNAAAYLGVPVKEIAARVTTVQFCLSKGLGAPVGSIVAGPKDFIAKVHHHRKMLGGGMRQAGVLAAPGLIALKETPKRIPQDHENARILAEGLNSIDGVSVQLDLTHTNIVIWRLPQGGPSVPEMLTALQQDHGIRMIPFQGGIRCVAHQDVSKEQCHQVVEAVAEILQSFKDRPATNGAGEQSPTDEKSVTNSLSNAFYSANK
eukprot:jgi/Astpho2/9965/e_gw1.00153.21.1_t